MVFPQPILNEDLRWIVQVELNNDIGGVVVRSFVQAACTNPAFEFPALQTLFFP